MCFLSLILNLISKLPQISFGYVPVRAVEKNEGHLSFLSADAKSVNVSLTMTHPLHLCRNEIAKLRQLSDSRQRACDEQKMQYASQLSRTNKYQADYFSRQLPGVLDRSGHHHNTVKE